jgi:hypothetical protein
MKRQRIPAPKTMARMATHLPLLVRAFDVSKGDVLEMGTGYFSTLILRWLCEMFDRQLYSYESNFRWFTRNNKKPKPFHHMTYVLSYDDAPIERPWGLAFIDHGPNPRRVVDIKRIAGHAEYIVIHDTQPAGKWADLPGDYHYEEIWPLFIHRYDYIKVLPFSSVVSNFHDLSEFR